MSKTVRQIISEVRNDLKALNVDTWIPGAYIHSKAVDIAEKFIKRDQDDRRMYNYANLWVTIECLPMKEINLAECCGITISDCDTAMRSIDKLPALYTSRYGYLLNISSIDYDKDYIGTTSKLFKYNNSRKYIDRTKRYFWLENDHIIVPGVSVEILKVKGMFKNKQKALRLGCEKDNTSCIRVLDEEFIAPGYLLEDIKKATVLSIITPGGQIVPDTFPNRNENEKTNPKL